MKALFSDKETYYHSVANSDPFGLRLLDLFLFRSSGDNLKTDIA